ncbi:hypothetical protein OROHE_005080 [Orobanche hederae]
MAAFFAARSTRKEELQRRNLNKQLPYLVGNIVEDGEDFVNPWFVATLTNLLQRMNSQVVKYEIQKPPFSLEFYMYRQLDMRIPENERKSFGFAHRLYLYSDYSDRNEDKNTCRR